MLFCFEYYWNGVLLFYVAYFTNQCQFITYICTYIQCTYMIVLIRSHILRTRKSFIFKARTTYNIGNLYVVSIVRNSHYQIQNHGVQEIRHECQPRQWIPAFGSENLREQTCKHSQQILLQSNYTVTCLNRQILTSIPSFTGN